MNQDYRQFVFSRAAVPEQVLIRRNTLIAALQAMNGVGKLLDHLKRVTFYEKTLDPNVMADALLELAAAVEQITPEALENDTPVPVLLEGSHLKTVHLLHGLIGLMAETSELGAIVQELLDHKETPTVNLMEELGDQNFFRELVLGIVGFSHKVVEDTNVAKLTYRLPNGYLPEMYQSTEKRDYASEAEAIAEVLRNVNPLFSKTPAQLAYEAYCEQVGGVGFDGLALPTWNDQQPDIKQGWEAAARAATSI